MNSRKERGEAVAAADKFRANVGKQARQLASEARALDQRFAKIERDADAAARALRKEQGKR